MTQEAEDGWQEVCSVADMAPETARRWDFGGRSYALFKSPDGRIFATDNVCTHQHAYLSEGFVEGITVECPRHAGRFDYTTGEPLGAPVCIDLRTYDVKVEDGRVLMHVSA